MSLLKEFKQFAMKGNVVDLAVGIIIGAAFGKIVSSVVNDIIMPPIGALVGGVDFTDLKLVIKAASVDDAGNAVAAVTMNYGNFVQTTIDFLIIAFAVFMIIKAINRMKRKEEAAPSAPPKPSNEEVLLTEIRDLLKK
ncbi:MAG: large-conductance mechanosensitive channel protein MscL [Bacteroidales bacterium]|nr:large-conductance mechanosensitive channel protein MscL [Bacteroidales bacterium]